MSSFHLQLKRLDSEKARRQEQPRPSRMTPNTGVYVACVPVSVRHACLYRCRLLQRDQHDAVCLLVSCLLVFVLHACSCLYRNLPRGSKVQGALKLVQPWFLALPPSFGPEAWGGVCGISS